MLELIKEILLKFVKDIDSGNCNMSHDKMWTLLNLLRTIDNPNEKLTKTQAAEYLNISVSMFEKLVQLELIPKGKQIDPNQKTKYWELFDLQTYQIQKERV